MSSGVTPEPLRRLETFDARVAERALGIRAVRADWPCRRGCDACCRRLARAPELTAAEWARVDEGVAALAPDVRDAVLGRVDGLRRRIQDGFAGPVVCPFLDTREGACLIYASRPLACRSYGFFVARDAPEVCEIIERDIAERGERGIVWGNAASLAADVRASLGEPVSFVDHFARDPGRSAS